MTNTPAKRGDLVALVRTVHTTSADFTRTSLDRVYLARVTSVTRDGVVKTAEGPWETYRRGYDSARVLVIPADLIDVTAALNAYGTRRYPSAPDSSMVPPFDDLHAARAFLAPFRTSTTPAPEATS